MIELPEVVRNRAVAAGEEDRIEELPDLVAALACDWQNQIGAQFDRGYRGTRDRSGEADGTR